MVKSPVLVVQEAPKTSKPRTKRTTTALFALLVFLGIYNFVPNAHEGIQSFLSLDRWSESAPRVELKQGTFVGKLLDSENHPVPIEAFLGIPYVLPPVGERRFARPLPVPDSNETFAASEYSMRFVRPTSNLRRLTADIAQDALASSL